MCVEVVVKQRGRADLICETVQGLADALGLQPIEVSPDPPENCLCNARWDDLGARQATEADSGWPMTGHVIDKSRRKQ